VLALGINALEIAHAGTQTGQALMSRLRGGSAGAARGAASFLTETISRVRGAGATGQLTLRADSAFYSEAVIATTTKSTSGSPSPPVRTRRSAPPSRRSARMRGSRSAERPDRGVVVGDGA
jgi:hypothetical protein